MHGKLYINNENVPYDVSERTKKSKFAKYRQLFKYAGKIFRKLNFSDQGRTNAEILQNMLNIDHNESSKIEFQGLKAYKIFKEIVKLKNYNYNLVEDKLKPIFEWYVNEYKVSIDHYSFNDILIDDVFKYNVANQKLPPKLDQFLQIDEAQNVYNAIESCELNSDCDEDYVFTSTDDYEEEEIKAKDEDIPDEDILPAGYTEKN